VIVAQHAVKFPPFMEPENSYRIHSSTSLNLS